MIGRVTIRDAIRATAGAVDLVERMSEQMEQAFCATAASNGREACRPIVRSEGESLVTARRGVVLQRITGEELLKLPETTIRRMLILERAMQNHYDDWLHVFPKMGECSEPLARSEWQRRLRDVVVAMRHDVEEVMTFLEQAGLRMDSHHAHVRNMIQSISSDTAAGGHGLDGTGFPHA